MIKSMKKIVICGSMSASKEMMEAAEYLKSKGYEVTVPHGADMYASGEKAPETDSESTENKRSGGLIRAYYDEIKEADAVLLMNVPKRGISGYIGGNAFLEYGFAHVLDKIIYLMFPYNETSPYVAEMAAMDAHVIDGDLSKINL